MRTARASYEIDCNDADVARLIVAANALPPYYFRRFSFKGRKLCPSVKTVALHYFRYGVGGGERVTYELVKLFMRLGLRVVLYTDESPSTDDYPVPPGCVRKQTLGDVERGDERVEYWRDEVKREQIDLVVYNSWHSPTAVIDCLAAQSSGSLFVYHTHGSLPYSMMVDDADLPRRLEVMGYLADSVVCLSDIDALFWRALNESVWRVVNPVAEYVALNATRDEVPSGKRVLWVGRMAEFDKRPSEAIRVFERLHAREPDARLTMVGDGPDLGSVRAFAEELGLGDYVEFLGYCDDPLPLYRSANALLITSVSEGFPLVMSEGMQQGIPIVMYELPFLTFFTVDTGCVQVPWGDAGQAAVELSKILSSPLIQEELGCLQREAFEEVCCVDLNACWKGIIEDALRVGLNETSGDSGALEKPKRSNLEAQYSEELVSTFMRAALFDFREHVVMSNRKREALEKRLVDALAEVCALRAELDEVYASKRYRIASSLADGVRRFTK